MTGAGARHLDRARASGQRLREGSRMRGESATAPSRRGRRPAFPRPANREVLDRRRLDRCATPSTRSVTCRCRRISSARMTPRSRSLSNRLRARADRSPRRRQVCILRRKFWPALADRGIERATVTLHVGYGTFQPVRVDRVEDHRVEAEALRGAAETAATALTRAKREAPRIIAVGTTTTRTLESLAIDAEARSPGDGETTLFIHPGIRVQDRRDHQFPPAEVVAVDAGRGVRRPRAILAPYRHSHRARLSLLQLR